MAMVLLTLVSVGISSQQPDRVRIVHIMSYHAEWPWNIDQLAGFRDGLTMPNADIRNLAIVTDESPMWDPVVERLREIDIVRQGKIRRFEEYQDSVDAIGLLGIFLFKDKDGSNVSYIAVLRWTAENSMLPDFTYWKDHIQYGTLCSVTVSGYEQGREAGLKARKILSGVSPLQIFLSVQPLKVSR